MSEVLNFTVSSKPDWVTEVKTLEALPTGQRLQITTAQNDTDSPRSGTIDIIQAESNKLLQIPINQEVGYNYRFQWADHNKPINSVYFDASAGGGGALPTESILVMSFKVLGGDYENPTFMDFGVTGEKPSFFNSWRIEGYSDSRKDSYANLVISLQDNPNTTERTGNLTIRQKESDKVLTLAITQRGKPVEKETVYVTMGANTNNESLLAAHDAWVYIPSPVTSELAVNCITNIIIGGKTQQKQLSFTIAMGNTESDHQGATADHNTAITLVSMDISPKSDDNYIYEPNSPIV